MYATSAAPEGSPAGGRRARQHRVQLPAVVRLAVAAVAGALAVASLMLYQEYARRQGALRQLIAAVELERRQRETVQRILWDPDVEMGRLQVARALLYEALDPGSLAALPPGERMTAMALLPERLELAREIAAQTLRQRPAAWAAAMILGASYYVEWSLRGDPRLLTERPRWERPLQVAAELAPGEDEPRKFLALAYMEIWPALAAGERARLLPLLREALADRSTFERAAGTWLAVAASPAEAQAAIPDTSWAWQAMAAHSARQRDWEGYAHAMERARRAHSTEMQAALAELELRRAGGDLRGARTAALGLLASATPERRNLLLAQRALELLPPGPVDGSRAGALRAWLDWALEMALWEQPSLSPAAVGRLAALLDPLPPPQAAVAALVAGNLPAAEALERRHEALDTEPWAPYCIIKARVLAARGEPGAAEQVLGRVQRLWVGSVPELRSRFAVAQSRGDAAAVAAADAALAAVTGDQWPATAWRWRGRVATAGLLAARPAPGVAITMDVAPSQGTPLQVSLDGQWVPVGLAFPGAEVVVAEPLDAGIHLLSVTSTGGRVVPGRFRLLPE